MSGNWLQQFIQRAVDERMCTRPFCTTCGAFAFRKGVLKALSEATGLPYTGRYDGDAADLIVEALAEVEPPDGSWAEFDDAASLLLIELWDGLIVFDRAGASRRLGSSWAGRLLGRMRAHSDAIAQRRASAPPQESREEIERRREEARRARQEAHQKRLELKKERDRLWWARHPRPS